METAVTVPMPRQTRWSWPGTAIGLAGSGLGVAALSLTLADLANPPLYPLPGLDSTWSVAARLTVQTVGVTTLSVIAGMLAWRQPRNAFTWLLASAALLVAFSVFAAAYAFHGLVIDPGSLPLADVAAWSQRVISDVIAFGGLMALLVFPDGRFKSPRWRLVAWVTVVVLFLNTLAGFDDPYPLRVGLFGNQFVPVTLPPSLWALGSWLSWASGTLFPALIVMALVAGSGVVVRMRSAHGESRLQLKWFAYAASIYFAAGLLGRTTEILSIDWLPQSIREFAASDVARGIEGWAGITSAMAGMVLVPLAIAVAMLRYRLYDIDVVINRTILYAGLAIFVTGGYAIVVAGVGSLLGQRAGLNPLLSIVTIAILAALLLPVRARLQAFANIAVYGGRARPYEVLSDFAGGIGRAEPADVLLPRMAELLREGTGASSTEVWVRVGERLHLAASAPPNEGAQRAVSRVDEVAGGFGDRAHVERVLHDGDQLGVLVVVKPRGDELTAMEKRLFHDLASQAGLVLGRYRLVQELHESRARLVSAQDLERKRVERNLHDGAQQRFANALLALGMAEADGSRNRRDLIEEASREVRAGLGELRSLARGLQPPLLAESGLVSAMQALADRTPIATTVAAAIDRRYPEPVESTAYFFVAEAVANAVKHSSAAAIEIRIAESGGKLNLEVADDGAGGADPSRGSGLMGLQDRVAAARGRIEIRSAPGRGTTLSAEIPCG